MPVREVAAIISGMHMPVRDPLGQLKPQDLVETGIEKNDSGVLLTRSFVLGQKQLAVDLQPVGGGKDDLLRFDKLLGWKIRGYGRGLDFCNGSVRRKHRGSRRTARIRVKHRNRAAVA